MSNSLDGLFHQGCFLYRVFLSGYLNNAVLPVAKYGFFSQMQPLPDIQHLRESRRKIGQLPCADYAAEWGGLLLAVGKTVVLMP